LIIYYILGQISAVVQGRNSTCDIRRNAQFDVANLKMGVSFSYDAYVNSTNCNDLIGGFYFSYGNLVLPNSDFAPSFDMRTLVVSMAVNCYFFNLLICDDNNFFLQINLNFYTVSNCIVISNCLQISGNFSLDPSSPSSPRILQFFDPRYAGMKNTYCISGIGEGEGDFQYACAMSIGGYIGLPVFNSHGSTNKNNPFRPNYCDW